MKIIVTGATGFIGRALVEALGKRGDQVVTLTRSAGRAREALGPDVEVLAWRPPQPGPWMSAFERADAVVNLAGEPIAAQRPTEVATRRWTSEQKDRILSSRVDATRAVVEAMRGATERPRVLVNGSAIGYYGSQGNVALDEGSAAGTDFLAGVVEAWEDAAKPVEDLGVRLVLLRTGIVLGTSGGVLPLMVLPFRLFTGGTMGEPGQWVSWIHLDDEVELIIYALTNDQVHGPVNATAPNPVTMDVLSRQIGQAVGRPSWVPLIGKAMKVALGEQAQAVLASQRVLPEVARKAGYRFRHTDSAEALRSILVR